MAGDDIRTAELAITITRTVNAAPERVFEAWSRPEHLAHWWGPHNFTVPSVEVDFRPGGAWRTCMRSPDGKDYWVGGTYREIQIPRRLVFTFAWDGEEGRPEFESLITVEFVAEGDKTRLTFHQAPFESAKSRDSHLDGWNQTLERLERFVNSSD